MTTTRAGTGQKPEQARHEGFCQCPLCELLAHADLYAAADSLRRSFWVTEDAGGEKFRYTVFSVPGGRRVYLSRGIRSGSLSELRRLVAGR